MAGPHDRDWAGPGFTKPGPESNACYQAGYALGKADAFAGMTTISDGPCYVLHRRLHQRPPRDARAPGPRGHRPGSRGGVMNGWAGPGRDHDLREPPAPASTGPGCGDVMARSRQ
jgi:hypothetical protein